MSRVFCAVLCAFLCFDGSASAFARTVTEKQKLNFIEAYVAAMTFEDVCKSWRLDLAKAALARAYFSFGDDDFAPGGRYHEPFLENTVHFKSKIAGIGEDMTCDMAEMMFGPSGNIIPGWMKRR